MNFIKVYFKLYFKILTNNFGFLEPLFDLYYVPCHCLSIPYPISYQSLFVGGMIRILLKIPEGLLLERLFLLLIIEIVHQCYSFLNQLFEFLIFRFWLPILDKMLLA
eukprot:NODE_285_length_10753_cov_0.438615.p10 type:complete len:107 gc:universal NODE_285_length_10753_cov_0.438615:5311-4991(-)